MEKLNKKEVKEIFNSPACKKWAKKMEEMYEEEYIINMWDYILQRHKQNLAKPIKLSPSREKGKKDNENSLWI